MLLMDTRPLGNDTSSAIYRMVIDLIMVEVFVERRGRIAVDVGRWEAAMHFMIRVRYL